MAGTILFRSCVLLLSFSTYNRCVCNPLAHRACGGVKFQEPAPEKVRLEICHTLEPWCPQESKADACLSRCISHES